MFGELGLRGDRKTTLGNRLLPKLWIGPCPPSERVVRESGFNVVVFCAVEIQPRAEQLPGVTVLNCPLRDDSSVRMTSAEWSRAALMAKDVALRVRDGQSVLVTCAQGRNRSGLVSALALHCLLGWRGSECVRYVQQRRPNALTNTDFVRQIVGRLG